MTRMNLGLQEGRPTVFSRPALLASFGTTPVYGFPTLKGPYYHKINDKTGPKKENEKNSSIVYIFKWTNVHLMNLASFPEGRNHLV